jgi:hypothetical protein
MRRIGDRTGGLEASDMKIIVFLVFVAACAIALIWAASRSRAERRAKRRREFKSYASSDSVLARKDEVWARRREQATTGVQDVSRFRPRSATAGAPEYDGYSRRDRHHVLQPDARIKDTPLKEDEELTFTAVEIKPDSEVVSDADDQESKTGN